MNTEQKIKPDKPIFINLKMDFDVHREIKALAALKGKGVNDMIREYIETRWKAERPLDNELKKVV